MKVLERFIQYVKMDTASKEDCSEIPSTAQQLNLANLLAMQLKEMGAEDVKVDANSYVYATIPSTSENPSKVIGFIAHLDTAPVVSGKDVKPIVHKNYDGSDIILPSGVKISPTEFETLKNYVGLDIVTSDGTTLLGADDKAGIAEIMEMAEYLLTHKEIRHGTVRIAFTPDEEVGNGANLFDVNGFGADFAFTVDGGAIGEIEYENFNAASAYVRAKGISIHPGDAKGKMINAAEIMAEYVCLLPEKQKPQYTEGYEGFFHLTDIKGDVNFAQAHFIIRDHDEKLFNEKKSVMTGIAETLNDKYGENTVEVEIKDSYKNMAEQIKPHMNMLKMAAEVFKEEGITPKFVPIRGGTDGARLSFMGLPCPNLCTGGHNYHSVKEYIPVQSMEKIAKCLIKIAVNYIDQ
jgi:tripeptide aminopeptidase